MGQLQSIGSLTALGPQTANNGPSLIENYEVRGARCEEGERDDPTLKESNVFYAWRSAWLSPPFKTAVSKPR